MLLPILVSTLCALALHQKLARAAITPANSTGNASWPYQTYRTANFTPPVLKISQPLDAADDYLFFAPDGATEFQLAPLIMDTQGNLVWNGPEQHANNFGVQTYNGEQVLVAWNGTVFPEPVGRGNGVVAIWNKHYEKIAEVTLPGNFLELVPKATYPSNIDLHEVYITTDGSMLVTANNVTQTDLTSVGGPPDGWVAEAQFYEIDIVTNKILFSWKSLDHLDQIPLNDSLYPLGSEGYNGTSQITAWGYFHINAVSPYNGGYLVGSRYLCSAIALDASGKVLWRLQERDGGDFTLGPGVDFCYQHDVRVRPPQGSSNDAVIVSMHDNHNSPIDNNTVPSSGKALNVDLNSKQVTLVQQYLNQSGPVYSTAQGNFQPLSNGNVFIGHGWIPILEEFSHSGQILSTIQFGVAEPRPGGGFVSVLLPTFSYRAFKQSWIGCPNTKPAVVAQTSGNCTTVYVSWNGATEVKAWAIFGGASETVEYVTTVPKTGFETAVNISSVETVQVKPVLKDGAMAGWGQNVTSDLVRVA